MTVDDVKNYFGTTYRFNKQTGMHHGCILNWKRQGFVPIHTQLKLEKLTKGELKASLDDITMNDCPK